MRHELSDYEWCEMIDTSVVRVQEELVIARSVSDEAIQTCLAALSIASVFYLRPSSSGGRGRATRSCGPGGVAPRREILL